MSGKDGEAGEVGPKVARSEPARSCEVGAQNAEGAYFGDGLERRRAASRSQRAGALLLVRELRRRGLSLALAARGRWVDPGAGVEVAASRWRFAAGSWLLEVWRYPDRGEVMLVPPGPGLELGGAVRWWGDLRRVGVRAELARRVVEALERAQKSPDGWSRPGVGCGGLVLG